MRMKKGPKKKTKKKKKLSMGARQNLIELMKMRMRRSVFEMDEPSVLPSP